MTRVLAQSARDREAAGTPRAPEFNAGLQLRVFRNTYIYGEIGRGVTPSIIAWRIGMRPEYLTPYVESFRSELVVDLAAALAETA